MAIKQDLVFKKGFISDKYGVQRSTKNVKGRWCVRRTDVDGFMADEKDQNDHLVMLPYSEYRCNKPNFREATRAEVEEMELRDAGITKEERIKEAKLEYERLLEDAKDRPEIVSERYRSMTYKDANMLKKDELVKMLELGYGQKVDIDSTTRSEMLKMVHGFKVANTPIED